MDIAKNSVRKRLSFVVISVLVLSMCFSQLMPMTAEAAKKKLAVKSVELKINGEKVNGKIITLKKGSSLKVSVKVSPSKSKKSVTYKSSKKKVATISKGKIKAKKAGTTRISVKVKGRNGKSKSAVFRIKVVNTLPKAPATPSKPSTPSTTSKTFTVRFNNYNYGYEKRTYSEGAVVDVTKIIDSNSTKSNSGVKFIGWYTAPNGGGSKVTSWKVTGDISLYSYCVAKDPMKDWNPTFVQGNVTLLASDEVYDNDGIKLYNDVVYSYMKEAWVECSCGTKCQFKVRDHKGNVLVVDHFLLDGVRGRMYVLTKDVQSTRTVSSDWAFLEITSAYNKVCMTQCTCNNIYNTRAEMCDGSSSATYNR